MTFIVSKNKVWKRFESPFFFGFMPMPMQTGDEYMLWRGGKIPLELWQSVLAFFLEHKSNEVQVRLFYNTETKQWAAHAFPQEYPSGMTTHEISGHPNMETDLGLFPHPWAYMGTVHHHCSASAFQSGTDHANEKEIVGIHITVGNLNATTLDLHGRVSVKFPGELDDAGAVVRSGCQEFYSALWGNWFELPKPVADVLPEAMHDNILGTLLRTPVGKEVGYPSRWKENLIARFCGPAKGGSTSYWAGGEWHDGEVGHPYGGGEYGGAEAHPYGRGVAAHSRGIGTARGKSHDVPRSAPGAVAQAKPIQAPRKVTALKSHVEAGMSVRDHEWFLHSVIGWMDPYWDKDEKVCGYHIDLGLVYKNMEFESEALAVFAAEKIGFVKTKAGTYCHPDDLESINTAFEELERTALIG